jgi:nitrite reductase/ring-hydroxylating ferredoxin subunit
VKRNNAVRLCKASEVSQGKAKQIELKGFPEPFAVYNVEGRFFLSDDICTHAMASLSDGDIEDGKIYCPLHGGAFDIATGAAVESPCTIPLRVHEIFQDGEDLYGIVKP